MVKSAITQVSVNRPRNLQIKLLFIVSPERTRKTMWRLAAGAGFSAYIEARPG